MKQFFLSILLLIGFCSVSIGQKIILTPDLVIKGGYIDYNLDELFSEKVEGVINSEISKANLHRNISTLIFLNKYESMEKEGRYIISFKKIPVGTDFVSTFVGTFSRSKSEISFMLIIDVYDSSYKYNAYKYTITDIRTDRRVERVDDEYVALAPQKDIENLKYVGFKVETITIAGIDLPTKGDINSVHRKRVAGMIAERNGYVNLCIKKGKTVRGLKSRWIEEIREMDYRLFSEIQLYKNEYNSVLEIVNAINSKIIEN